MASSLPNNAFERGACVPCLNSNRNTQNQGQEYYNNQMHTDNVTPESEAFLAAEMYNLSAEERNRALDDVHCVGEELEETPELVEKILTEFDQAALKEQNAIYEKALSQNRAYVEDRIFRLKFLRANFHDVERSVSQMMSMLQYKAQCFGLDNVAREIQMSDLTEEDVDLIKSGHYHIQDGRDRAGRRIFHVFDNRRIGHRIDTWMRVTYYVLWNVIAFPNDNAQTKGLVGICHVSFGLPDFNFFKEATTLFNSMPLRFSSLQYCLNMSSPGGNNPGLLSIIDGLLSAVLRLLPEHTRARSRIHHLSSMEQHYQLRSYGIPIDTFPVDVDGNICEDILYLWLSKHLQETNQTLPLFARAGSPPPEQEIMDMNLDEPLFDLARNMDQLEPDPFPDQIAAPAIAERPAVANEGAGAGINPTERDVLFGRGTSVQSHAGNIRFREFLRQHRDEYDNAPRYQRQEVTIRLVQILRRTGVRFLRKTALGEWIESDIVQAENKVGQYLRELRKADE